MLSCECADALLKHRRRDRRVWRVERIEERLDVQLVHVVEELLHAVVALVVQKQQPHLPSGHERGDSAVVEAVHLPHVLHFGW